MSDNSTQNLFAFIALFIFLLIAFFSKKKSKLAIAMEYNISKPTLSKWVRLFQSEIDIKDWRKKRDLSASEVAVLKSCFGADQSYVLSKKQIAEMTGSNYKTVSAVVKLNLNKIGLTLDAWESCNVFPPNISRKIIEVLG